MCLGYYIDSSLSFTVKSRVQSHLFSPVASGSACRSNVKATVGDSTGGVLWRFSGSVLESIHLKPPQHAYCCRSLLSSEHYFFFFFFWQAGSLVSKPLMFVSLLLWLQEKMGKEVFLLSAPFSHSVFRNCILLFLSPHHWYIASK